MKKIIFYISLFFATTISVDLSAQSSARAKEDLVSVYPNPTHGDVTLRSTGNQKIKSVDVFSLLGTPILNYEFNQPMVEVNLERLKPGKYFLRYVLSDNTQKVKQIIKQ